MFKLFGLIVIAAVFTMTGYAEEINVRASAGEVIASGMFCGNVFAFPSEQMDGFFWYGGYAFEDFGNWIDFYDFEKSKKVHIVRGGNDNGYGHLTNQLNGKSLLPDKYNRGAAGRINATSGEIKKIFLDDDGSLVFQSEARSWHRISFTNEWELVISDANVTDVNSPYIFDNIEEKMTFEYDKVIDRNNIMVMAEDGKIILKTPHNRYSIDGLDVSGVQLSKDSSKLAVFAKGNLWNIFSGLDGSRKTRLIVTEEDKKEIIIELEKELSEAQSEHGARDINEVIEFWSRKEVIIEKVSEELRKHKLNILIVYDLKRSPFVQNAPSDKKGLNKLAQKQR